MANPPPAGRWIRLATMRQTAVPTPEPSPAQPPAPQLRPTLGRTFTIGFRPSIPQVPQPQQIVVLPPPPPPIVQLAPLPPQVPSVRDVSTPPPVPPIVSPSPPKTPPPPAATTTPSPRHTPPPAPTTVPSPRRTPSPAAPTVPSPHRTPPPASANPSEVSPSPRITLPAILPNAMPSLPKSPVAPTYSPPSRSPLAPTSSSPPQPPPPRTPPGVATNAVPPQPPTAAFNEMSNVAPPPRSPEPASVPTIVPSSPLKAYPVPTKSASGSTTMGRISPNVSKPQSPRPFLAPTTSQPTSSVPKVVTSSSVTTVPNPVESPILVSTTNNRGTSPATSPKTTLKSPERTPPQSPMIRVSNAPPSPLHLPPPQLKSDEDYEAKDPPEAEKKTVLFQKIIDQQKPTMHNGVHSGQVDSRDTFKARISANHGRHEVAKGLETKENATHKKLTSSDELGARILTIAGENKGAVMELGYSQRKQDHFPGHPHTLQNQNSKSNGKASENHSSSGEEGKSKKLGKNQMKDAMSSPPMNAITNSNVQGINNSLLFNSSCTHHDPGVHLSLTRKPSNGHKFHFKDNGSGHHS